jgi:hypothetical protein
MIWLVLQWISSSVGFWSDKHNTLKSQLQRSFVDLLKAFKSVPQADAVSEVAKISFLTVSCVAKLI